MSFDQESLDRASFELQRFFGREGSIYGIKACEEIVRIALTAYGARPEARLTEQEWKYCRDMFYGMADIHSDPGDRMFEILCKRLKVDKPSPQNDSSKEGR